MNLYTWDLILIFILIIGTLYLATAIPPDKSSENLNYHSTEIKNLEDIQIISNYKLGKKICIYKILSYNTTMIMLDQYSLINESKTPKSINCVLSSLSLEPFFPIYEITEAHY